MAKLDLVDVFKKRTRHPFRPRVSDIIDRLFPDFKPIENTGCSLILGSCSFLNKDLLVIGQQKPKPSDFKNRDDLNILNYGMLTSDDHSRILTNLKQAKEADPSVGGAIASYAAPGDVTIAEPGALLIFSGPRMMQWRGFKLDERLVRANHLHRISDAIYERLDYYHDIRGIQEVCERKDMKLSIAKFLELYRRTNYRPKKRSK